MSDIPTKYYRKELFSSPLFLSRGVRAPFEPTGNDEGILATEDSSLIFSLSNAIARRIGGVFEIAKDEYERLKKKGIHTKPLSPRQAPPRAAPAPHVVMPKGQAISSYLPQPSQNQEAAVEAKRSTPEPPKPPSPKELERGKAAKLVRRGKTPDAEAPPAP